MGLVKNPTLFGGQAFTAPPRLCNDCAHRPATYASLRTRSASVPCALRPELDAYDARQACRRGEDWVLGR